MWSLPHHAHAPLPGAVLALSLSLAGVNAALSGVLTTLMIGWYVWMYYKEWKANRKGK